MVLILFASLLFAGAASLPAGAAPAQAQDPKSILDRIYSEAQAQRGEQQFKTSCRCGDETRACFGGGTVSTGNDTCSQIYDCFAGCQDEACYTACYGDGTAAAQGQIDAMYGCFDTNCASGGPR